MSIQLYYGMCEQDDEDGQYVLYDDHMVKLNDAKAEGIMELVSKVRTCNRFRGLFSASQLVWLDEYADKLASDNEALEDKNGI